MKRRKSSDHEPDYDPWSDTGDKKNKYTDNRMNALYRRRGDEGSRPGGQEQKFGTNCKHSIPVLYVVPSNHWRSSMG